MIISEMILGKMVKCEVKRTSHRKLLNDENITDSLVQFEPEDGIVTVDERASENYAKYAALHECVCCGKYAYLVPHEDPLGRCARIDELVMALMPATYRREYSEKRLEMFKTLLEKNLNPSLNESFKRSLRFHQKYLEK